MNRGVKIDGIRVLVDDTYFVFSIEEARALYNQLHSLFGYRYYYPYQQYGFYNDSVTSSAACGTGVGTTTLASAFAPLEEESEALQIEVRETKSGKENILILG